MSLMRRHPLREMVSLRDAMNRLFDESWLRPWWSQGESSAQGVFVPVDVYETDNEFVVSAAMPGMKPEDVDINITGDTLTVSGEFREEKEEEKRNVHFRERRYGAFRRSIGLPATADTEGVEATFEDGVLKISMAKKEEAKPKQIQVKAK